MGRRCGRRWDGEDKESRYEGEDAAEGVRGVIGPAEGGSRTARARSGVLGLGGGGTGWRSSRSGRGGGGAVSRGSAGTRDGGGRQRYRRRIARCAGVDRSGGGGLSGRRCGIRVGGLCDRGARDHVRGRTVGGPTPRGRWVRDRRSARHHSAGRPAGRPAGRTGGHRTGSFVGYGTRNLVVTCTGSPVRHCSGSSVGHRRGRYTGHRARRYRAGAGSGALCVRCHERRTAGPRGLGSRPRPDGWATGMGGLEEPRQVRRGGATGPAGQVRGTRATRGTRDSRLVAGSGLRIPAACPAGSRRAF